MTIRGWWEDKLRGTRAAGAVVQLGASVTCSFAVIEKKNSKLEIISKGSSPSIEEITIPAGTPLSISISGKGILHKRTGWTEGMSEAALLQKVLPNARPQDFYVQHTSPVNDHVIVSVARRSSIDEVLAAFTKNKYQVVSCTLGPFCISSIIPALGLDGIVSEQLCLPGHTITITDGQVDDHIISGNHDAAPLRIGNEDIEPWFIIPFAAATGYFTGNDIAGEISSVSEQAEEWKQKRKFRLSGIALITFLFTVLLANYLVFDHYWKRKQALAVEVSLNDGALGKYTELKKQYDEKMEFLRSTGLLKTSRASFYADRLAMDIPPVIQLTEMNIDPLIKSADDDDLEFEPGAIRVAGSCRQSNELNEWIKIIRKKDWVSNVELINYKQGKNDPAGEFIINVTVR